MAQVRMLKGGADITSRKRMTRYAYSPLGNSSESQYASLYELVAPSLSNKISSFVNALSTNVDNAITAYGDGLSTIIEGLTKSENDNYLNAINRLFTTSTLLRDFVNNFNPETGTYKGKLVDFNTVRELGKVAEAAGVDYDSFYNYFKDYYPKESPYKANKSFWENKNYKFVNAADLGYNLDILDYLARTKTNLMLDADGNIYALDESYSRFNPLKHINLDWRTYNQENSPYNQYVYVDPETGRIYNGNYADLSPEDPLYDIITSHRNDIINRRKGTYSIYSNFNKDLNYIDENKLLYRLSNAKNLRHSLNNFADVSGQFKGNKQVIAVNKDNEDFVVDEDGSLRFTPNTTLYFIDDNNHLLAFDWGDPRIGSHIGKYNPEGWGERRNQLGSTLQGIHLGETTIASDSIKNPQEWANRMLDLMTKPRSQRTTEDIRELEKYNGLGNSLNILAYIGSLISETGLKLDEVHLKKWNELTTKFRTSELVLDEKPLDLTGEELDKKLKEEADEAGYSNAADYLDYKEGSERKPSKEGWSTTDIVRLSAIAADLGSLAWSVSDPEPLSNIIGSSALGLTSTGMNAYADFKDKGVSAGDAWKNLGINLGFDVLGVIPGGQSAKVVKNLARILGRNVPLVLGVINGFNHKEDYKEAFDKLLHSPKDLTVKDYQRLSEIVHVVIRGTKSNIGGIRTKPNANGEVVQASALPAWKGAGKGVKTNYVSAKTKVSNWKDKLKGTKPKTETTTTPDLEDQYETFLGNTSFREGGKLDRFGEYLKSHK